MSSVAAFKPSRTPVAGFNEEIAEEMVGRAREVSTQIARSIRQSDIDRRMSDENYAALEDAGLLDLVCPVRDGGHGTS